MPRSQTNSRKAPKHSGYTLIELLVATTILSLLLVMLAQVANLIASTWSSGNGRAERRQNGRALVDFIGQEMRAAALPVDKTAGASSADLHFVINPTTVATDLCQPHAAFWQAPIATDARLGDMAVVGYFIRWSTQPNDPTVPKASLCRVFINPCLTSDPPVDPPMANPQHRVYKNAADWITTAVLDAEAPATDASGYRGLFADNVIGLFIRCFDAEGNRITQAGTGAKFNSRIDYNGREKNAAGSWAPVVRYAPTLPDSVEISLVLLDTRAASRLSADTMSIIKAASASSDVLSEPAGSGKTPADGMIKTLQDNVAMRQIIPGMSSHSLRIYLENAP